jgi:molecular chaperone GrpE
MRKENGKTEAAGALDLEHELAAGEVAADPAGTAGTAGPDAGEAEVLKLRAERDSLLERLARAQAEFENARRRAVREQQDFREFATADAVKAMLPVADNFERALRAKSDAAEFRSGVELIYKQLNDVFGRLGVQVIAAEGQPFDPRLHEAVEMVETDDAPDQTVVEELQRGYRVKDRLLRPAMVRVAKNPGK